MDIKNTFRPADIAAAMALLTRLPVPVDHEQAAQRGATLAWAFPVVGALLGLLAGLVANLCLLSGTGGNLAAIAALGTLVLATGALHEDGLADCADGFGGGRDANARLEIMKDSRIGTYGAVALILAFLARGSGIATFDGWTLSAVLITVGAGSRAVMAFAMGAMVNAREGGLSASYGRPDMPIAWAALALAVAIGLVSLGFAALPILLVTLLGALPLLVLAQHRIGGQTGDVLGAAQQCAEIAGIVAAVVVLT